MPRPVLFTTEVRMPGTVMLTQLRADALMREHHAEAARRGLTPKMPRIRVRQEGDELVHSLDYRAARR